MKSVHTTILTTLTSMPLVWAASVFAADVASAPPETSISQNGWSAVIDLINLARNWLFGILLAVIVVFILLAAFNFLTSGGSDEKVKKAKGMLRNAVIALVVGLLCGSIILVVTAFFDASTGNQSNNPNVPQYGPSAPGGKCVTDSDCGLGYYCDNKTLQSTYTCLPVASNNSGPQKKANGSSCTSGNECSSGYCNQQGVCANSLPTPPPTLLTDGSLCTQNYECLSGYCACISGNNNCAFTGKSYCAERQ